MPFSALYESVTNGIIADLEKGVAVKPWSGGGVGALARYQEITAAQHSHSLARGAVQGISISSLDKVQTG